MCEQEASPARKKLYLVTGATGHVGTVLVPKLLQRDADVRALVLPGRGGVLPRGVQVCEGDITKPDTLPPFFDRDGYDRITLLHCAALITIASKHNPRVWDINVNGTVNVLRAAQKAGVDRVVYVSSVHAIPEKPHGETISEVSSFSPELVHGQYARSKAAAAQKALEFAEAGLNLSVVHPSGIIGPGDESRRNHMIRTLHAMAEGKIPVGLVGGYDFVDSRDVADGILACEEKGRPGECYILNGDYVTVLDMVNIVRKARDKRATRIEVPYAVVKAIAPIAELSSKVLGKSAPLLTPYSVYTLHTNGLFSHEKATREFGYSPRPMEVSIRDSITHSD